MVAIISEPADQSTNAVIDWIIHNKQNFIRINAGDETTRFSLKLGAGSHSLETDFWGNNRLLGFWYRRGEIKISRPAIPSAQEQNDPNIVRIYRQLRDEIQKLESFSYIFLQENAQNALCDFQNATALNKLAVLSQARNAGLQIPDTLVTGSRSDVELFAQKSGPLVSKPIGEVVSIGAEDGTYIYTYTREVNIQQLPLNFFPSLFQKKIEKRYELRIFYIQDQFYSMAIFSQNDTQTQTDFRNYNMQKPNRCVPFSLPAGIQKKLKKLFNSLKLNTGSVDMLVDTNGEYYFLEINPVGQYGMVALPCNYWLDEAIASFLTTESDKV